MKVFKTRQGILIENKNDFHLLVSDWDEFINNDNIYKDLSAKLPHLKSIQNENALIDNQLLAPIGSQEIWASGVTYYRSREARIEESKDAGGGDFYDRVYNAERPELFFKSPSYRAKGSGEFVRIRKDSKWNVPEPELTLVITSNAKIIGYTIGNDMSSRDIEGENPLYLPQAKSYDGSTAIGPCIYISENPIELSCKIKIVIYRDDKIVFSGDTTLSQMKRKHEELVEYLYRETSFPSGCYLMTGTGIVPPDSFTLQPRDIIKISIDHIGTLINTVE